MGNQQKTKAYLESEVAELRRQVDALAAALATRQATEFRQTANDQLLQSLLDTQPHSLYRIDRHGQLTFANPVILQRWGLPMEQVLGHSLYEFLPNELAAVSRADDQVILSSGGPQRRVYEYFDSALGQTQLIQSVKFPLRDAAHNIIGLQGVFWDVTLHEEAQRALQKRNAELSVLNRSLQALTSTLNLNEVLTLVLNELRQMLTVSASSIWLLEPDSGQLVCREATGPHSDLVRGWHLPQDSGFVGWVLQHKQSLIVADAHTDERHFTSVDHDTGLAMRSIISVPLCAEQQIIGVIQAVDVNPDRFSADDLRLMELLATAAAIAIANARLFEKTWQRAERLAMLNELSTALNQPTDLMALLQTTTENLTRVLKADQMGLALMDDARDYLTVVADVSAPGSPPALGWKIPVAGNLSMQHVLETKVPLVIQDVPHSSLLANIQTMMLDRRIESMLLVPLVLHGEVIGTYGCDALDTPRHFTPEDIELAVTVANMIATRIEQARLLAAERDQHLLMENHAKELEQRVAERTLDLSEANEQLKGLDRMKDQFISRISHELRTPLANIKLYANLLEHGRPEKRGAYLQTLNHEADRLDRLIEDLLDVSYLSSATSPIDLLSIDLNHFVHDLCSDRQPLAQERGLTLGCKLAPQLPLARASLSLLTRAAANILVNALNYTPQGSITLATNLQSIDGIPWVTLTFHDTGAGMVPQEVEHIFERFYRGQAASNYKVPGAGLGLFIAQMNLERMGGRITVQSEPGQGSSFTLWLQAVDPKTDVITAGGG